MSAHDGVQRFLNGLEAAIKWTTVPLLAALCVNVFVQVLLRYIFGYSARWTLEISRYLMVWIVLLACGPALRHAFLVGVDMVKERLRPRSQLVVACVGRMCMGVFSVVVIVQALKLMQAQWEMGQNSPAMEVPMALVSLGIPIGFTVYLVYLLALTFSDLLGLVGRR